MAERKPEYEAMIIPRGARIIAGNGAEIELDVQGDLVLQESQQGLTSLVSHHGSILIDKDVVVRSRKIQSPHLIRVRGRLETHDINAGSVSVEGGTVHCEEMHTKQLECIDGNLTTNAIKAEAVQIKGGSVEIGSINATSLKLENRVRGSILISSARERSVDETVQVKGGFESDVELLGYLLKYRRQIMSDRVLKELQSRQEGRELRRFLLDEKTEPGDEEAEPAAAIEVQAEVAEETAEPAAVGSSDIDARPSFTAYADRLEPQLPEKEKRSALMKLVIASLRQGDLQTLRAIFQRWTVNLREEMKNLPDGANAVLEEIQTAVNAAS